eukprot:5749146-Alexandrium_andersonii.AAC.1
MRWLRDMVGVGLTIQHIDVELELGDCLGVQGVKLPALPTHATFSALWRAGDLQQSVSLIGAGGRSEILRWWQHVRQLGWGSKHPALWNKSLGELSSLIGIVLHADGVQFFRTWGCLCKYVVYDGADGGYDARSMQLVLQGPLHVVAGLVPHMLNELASAFGVFPTLHRFGCCRLTRISLKGLPTHTR